MENNNREEVIFGINPVKEALRGTREAFELFVVDKASDQRIERLERMAQEKNIPVRKRKRSDLLKLCGTDRNQGVVLRIQAFAYSDFEIAMEAWRSTGEPGLFVVLDEIQDPYNLGAIIRTAACTGVNGVIIPKDRAARVTAIVEKAASGATETVPVIQITNISIMLEEFKKDGFWIYGGDPVSQDSLYQLDLKGNVVIVIGNEGQGIRPLVCKKCDGMFSIPLLGGVESLNASVAAGVTLFEVVRQRVIAS
ncbi:MAG: 23S rRNA (guanosine(2251)-2'-O)-methyltransferase RlmB [Desulfuromonadales bacterium]|nr:23S rRNA (guanosine(2251)-2'-O)-methyltransferase RlmB [Desulfuromonadales bacterium]